MSWDPAQGATTTQLSANARAFISATNSEQDLLELLGGIVEQLFGGTPIADSCTIEEGIAMAYLIAVSTSPKLYGTNNGTPGTLEQVTVPGDGTPTRVATLNVLGGVPYILEAKLTTTATGAATVTTVTNQTSPPVAGPFGTVTETDLTAFGTGLGTPTVEQGGRIVAQWEENGTVDLMVYAISSDGSDVQVYGMINVTPVLTG